MINAKVFQNMLVNAEATDEKHQLRNLNYENLLDLAVGQRLLISELEQGHLLNIEDIEHLRKELSFFKKKLFETLKENRKLQKSTDHTVKTQDYKFTYKKGQI